MFGQKKRALIIALVVLTAVGVGTLIKRNDIAEAINGRRSVRHLENSKAALDSGDVATAERLAFAALQLDPMNLEALRTVLRVSAIGRQSQVLNFAAKIFIHPEATEQDRAQCLAFILESRDYRLFSTYFNAIPETVKSQPDFLYLNAGYFASQGDSEQALKVLAQGPIDDSRFVILKLAIQSVSADESTRLKGQRELAALISSDDQTLAHQAFRKLRTIPLEARELEILKPAVDQWSRSQSKINPLDRLTVESFDWLSHPPESDARIELQNSVIRELGSSTPLLVSQWLLELQQWDSAYNFSSKALANTDELNESTPLTQALFWAQLQALGSAGRWEEQLALLATPPRGLPPVRIALARATAAKNSGKTAEFSRHFQEAWDYAEVTQSRGNFFLDLYRWARQSGEPKLAVRAMSKAVENELGVLPPTDEITQFLVFLANNEYEKDLVMITDGLFRREFFDAALVNNANYLRELTGNQIPNGVELSKVLAETAPDTIGFSTTLILAHINREQYTEALSAADRITTRHRVNDLLPAESIIIAGAYRFAGKKHLAAEQNIDEKMAAVTEIERRVFEPWFRD